MRVEKITYQQTFPTGNFQNQKLGMEITIEPQDNLLGMYAYAKHMVEDAFKAMNPDFIPPIHDYHTGEQQSVPTINKAAERVQIMIENSTSLNDLELIYAEVAKYNDPPRISLIDNWNIKYNELKNQ